MSGIGSAFNQFLLPFSTLSGNRKSPFSDDMEVATIFSLAELDRAKSGGLMSKRAEEQIVFIAKVGYPLWLYPWSKTTLIFDGLNRASYTLPYPVVPDVQVFVENLKRSSKTLETYLAFLSDHINYFQAPIEEKTVVINGMIRDPEFLSEFESYRHQAAAIEAEPVNVGLLSPTIEESAISPLLKDLEALHFLFKRDTDGLYQCMKFANKSTKHYLHVLRNKTQAVKQEFKVKIQAQKELIAPKINSLKEKYDHQILKATKAFDKKRLPVQKRKVKLEKSIEQAISKIENCKLDAKTCAERDNSVGERKWKEKASETKKQLSEIENQLKETEKALRDMQERKELEIFNLRSELDVKTKEARQPLLELESSRDAKKQIYKQEMDKLEQQTKLILEQLGRTVKLREASISNFEQLGVKKDSELMDVTLFYVPFYVICYQLESKRRYQFLPPSEVNTIGFSTRLKSALGRAKIKQLLVRRFEMITSLMDTMQVLNQQNAVFRTELMEIGKRVDVLNVGLMRDKIKKGLETIQKEGWLSEKDYQALSQKII